MILTLDLGTSTIKAVVWDAGGPTAVGRAPVLTAFPAGDRAEQDPADWWVSLVVACAEARAASPSSFAAVEAVGCAAARQTFVPVTAAGHCLGAALLWSDRRASAEARALAASLGGAEAVHLRTGAVLDGASPVAKVAWLAAHEPDRLAASRWLLTPRDLLVWRMTGEVLTDSTMLSAAGLGQVPGGPLPALRALLADRLPPVVAPDSVAGSLSPAAAAELGLRPGLPVVVGAGDRACEVIGVGATSTRPMVSWGTTANVSVPVPDFPDPVPGGLVVTAAASSGWLLEGGLSAAGSLLTWLSTLTGLAPAALMSAAAAIPAGAHGLLALPWFGGARAPWWRDRARGAFVGLSFDHGPGDLARAVVESVAWEVLRCLAAAGAVPDGSTRGTVTSTSTSTSTSGTASGATALALTGADPSTTPWARVLTAVTGLPAERRRSGQAASAGAALLTARTIGTPYRLDDIDPVVETVLPDEEDAARYAGLRPRVDRLAETLVAHEPWPG